MVEDKPGKQVKSRLGNPNIAEAGKPYQWQPGQSGNPSGRAPNKKYLSEIARELLEEVPKGELEGRNADILVVLALIRKGVGGDTRAIEMLHDWTEGKVADTHKIVGDVPVSIVYKLKGENDGIQRQGVTKEDNER